MQKLALALYVDAADGNLDQDRYDSKGYAEFSYEYPDGRYGHLSVQVPASAVNTQAWAAEYTAWLKENGKIEENGKIYD